MREWLGLLSIEDKKRIGHDIAVVQFEWPIGMPICRPLGDGLWEIRSTLPSGREARILFGFAQEQMIAVHSFFSKRRRAHKNVSLMWQEHG
ncbi:MAG: type II toxin-antitoxin system RelE/ParE family toxin [Hyphomicrobiales bacterium]